METESTWTKARPDCPHPEYWHAPDPDSTELEVSLLVGAFVQAVQPEVVVETGSAFGQTARAIGLALEDNKHGHLYTLEPDVARAETTELRCLGLPVTVLRAKSLEWDPHQIKIDLAWIDSLIPLRIKELDHFLPHMSPNAVIGIHDTGPHFPERLGQQVSAWAQQHGFDTLRLPTPRGVMFLSRVKY